MRTKGDCLAEIKKKNGHRELGSLAWRVYIITNMQRGCIYNIIMHAIVIIVRIYVVVLHHTPTEVHKN